MYNIAVVEDDRRAATELVELIEEYAKNSDCTVSVDVFDKSLVFSDEYKSQYDLLLLDINMPAKNGMDVARQIRSIDSNVVIVFVTDMIAYAVQGYSVDALDFIVKPVKYGRLATTLARAFKRIDGAKNSSMMLRHNGVTHKVLYSDIIYVEVSRHKLVYHTVSGDIDGWGTIDSVQDMLPKSKFLRCHLGYIVGVKHILRVDGNEVIMFGNVRLPISRNRKTEFMAEFAKCLGDGDV